jgi:hypothetical protein
MKCSVALSLTLCLSFPTSAGASSVLTIFAATANGTNGAIVTLEVAPGLGLNLNLISTGEVVEKAWIDDPSRITLSFDGNLCQPMSDNQPGATRFCGVRQKDLAQSPTEFCRQPSRTAEAILI